MNPPNSSTTDTPGTPNPLLEIPEVKALDAGAESIRIPDQINVPVTPRVMRLVDTAEFRRLKGVSQLGIVSLVYPAAKHDRFEHSLGVYRICLLFIRQLARQRGFQELISPEDCHCLILAALLHDIGHWPFCHPIEDLQIPGIAEHETFAAEYLRREEISGLISDDWGVSVERVIGLLQKSKETKAESVLSSILSGPIDVDKMDYLYRDSLHTGVPYGRNFDAPRLIGSLCLNEASDRLAITHKGKTAAELMVFARYVMFSEVYWHHAVRSGTAMFQRAFYLWHQQKSPSAAELSSLFRMDEREMIAQLRADIVGTDAQVLLDGLFGEKRSLYKRLATYNFIESPELYRQVAQKPYPWLVDCSRRLADALGEAIGQEVGKHQVLVDAPPVGLEVQFKIDVYDSKRDCYRKLGEISPVVNTLAQEQFDNFVKQLRVFVAPELIAKTSELDIDGLIAQAVSGQKSLI